MKLALLNTTIATALNATYELRTLALSEAQQLYHECADGNDSMHRDGVQSYIGHESTAQLFTTLMSGGAIVEMNRQQFSQEVDQSALVLKLKGRAPEGVILNLEEIEAIGYEFVIMTRIA